ncbi:predicted protein [Chaetomium globosum CBS 148.51]|uniref:Uncharacterized protein n=1 Tax=Chaetomium globosum (strain ATCC 6205 / CBS 148.51 / DSM 1962 / NBRC 6347 / NRRL 1970) TaxID=306901 RepID=Q2GT87_CHAGB|nr:uncharacterized protein CHGG_08817 [Chaetomium globosum CBS 148.51]EAQ84803.1 predicted protein [Chaetomium globosum CBS 148.51]
MVVSGYQEKEGESLTPFYNLITTKTTQLKQSVHPWSPAPNGQLTSRPHNASRILNAAAALRLISAKTTIPVPRLLGSGTNPDGNAWLETERAPHGVWLDVVRDRCRMPPGKRHVAADDSGECDECDRIARANARRFVADEVLPQLNALTSDVTGLGGRVIPPLWVAFHEGDPGWVPKKMEGGEEGEGLWIGRRRDTSPRSFRSGL